MIRRTLAVVVAGLVVLGGVSMASAQDGEPVTHKGSGYSLTAPAGWEVVSGELEEAEVGKLPEKIKEHYNSKSTDVMFMDLATGGEGAENEFKDNLNVVVLDEPVPITDELVAELQGTLNDQYGKLFENFKLEKFEKSKVGAHDVLKIHASYELLSFKLYLFQMLVSGPAAAPDKALVVTCTVAQSRKDEREGVCDNAFASLAFE